MFANVEEYHDRKPPTMYSHFGLDYEEKLFQMPSKS